MQRPLFTLPLPSVLINALIKAGYNCFEDFLTENGECDKKVQDILKCYKYSWTDIIQLVTPPITKSADLLLKSEALKAVIPTFSQEIDNALGGGLSTETVTHLCGPPGSGKTQFVLQLCVNVQIPTSLGGLGREAIFIDTDSGFSIERLTEISESVINHCQRVADAHNLSNALSNFTVDSILDHVHYLQVGNYIQLLAAIHSLDSMMMANPKVIITNHFGTKLSNNKSILIPSLGESLSHITSQTILLDKIEHQFSLAVHKSNELPDCIVPFRISREGLRDIHFSN